MKRPRITVAKIPLKEEQLKPRALGPSSATDSLINPPSTPTEKPTRILNREPISVHAIGTMTRLIL